jgi:hypothetical protein
MARVPYSAAVPLIRAIYARDDGGAGCCMHVVLDDGNVETGSIRWVLDENAPCVDCRRCAEVLLSMSVTARKKAIGRAFSREF